MSRENVTVAIYDSHCEVNEAVAELRRAGFDIKKVSVAARDCHTRDQVFGYYNGGNRMEYWGELGGFWGGLWALLSGWGFFSIPGIGPVLVAGPLAGWIMSALENEPLFGGLSALGAGLYSIGIHKRSVAVCEAALRSDRYLVIAYGASGEVTAAREVLKLSGAAEPGA